MAVAFAGIRTRESAAGLASLRGAASFAGAPRFCAPPVADPAGIRFQHRDCSAGSRGARVHADLHARTLRRRSLRHFAPARFAAANPRSPPAVLAILATRSYRTAIQSSNLGGAREKPALAFAVRRVLSTSVCTKR